ncbi:hypothetical protein OOK41_31630 [Micromonospora sp. NBC_01655]|uniref:hypothetical protein n=1 Tax=Micromonospora sp. NBC_01655 TaxID=2975983 RepID=UPI002258C37B|nr:hypothetical protein [Micromonospora sp. NBC_01655]MCX4468725.1 hypothetical protein [Micromonospora sp. NBC_01655]MCX4474813.1 hypothetical protein [Micromonospora sp. NBC_01655]
MARVKQPYDEARFVPWIGRSVAPGDIVEVPDEDLANYLEAGWTAAQDKDTKRAVEKLDKPPTSGEEQG